MPEDYLEKNQPFVKYFKHGHKGILNSEETDPNMKVITTYKDDYVSKNLYDPNNEAKGNLKKSS